MSECLDISFKHLANLLKTLCHRDKSLDTPVSNIWTIKESFQASERLSRRLIASFNIRTIKYLFGDPVLSLLHNQAPLGRLGHLFGCLAIVLAAWLSLSCRVRCVELHRTRYAHGESNEFAIIADFPIPERKEAKVNRWSNRSGESVRQFSFHGVPWQLHNANGFEIFADLSMELPPSFTMSLSPYHPSRFFN